MNVQLCIRGRFDPNNRYSPFQIFKGKAHYRRLNLLLGLHQKKSPSEIILANGWQEKDIRQDLIMLKEAGLIVKEGASYFPGFFLILREELRYVTPLAAEFSSGMVDPIQDLYREIRLQVESFSFSRFFTWEQLSFLVLGGFIFLQGINAITRQVESLFLQEHERPGGHYNLWGIEDSSPRYTGRYTHHCARFGSYQVVTVGSYKDNKAIQCPLDRVYPLMKKMGKGLAMSMVARTFSAYEGLLIEGEAPPAEMIPFMQHLGLLSGQEKALVPVGRDTDCRRLETLVCEAGKQIGAVFRTYRRSLLETFYSFRASRHAPFSDFFFWFYPLVAAEAIDTLVRRNLVHQPDSGFSACLFRGKFNLDCC